MFLLCVYLSFFVCFWGFLLLGNAINEALQHLFHHNTHEVQNAHGVPHSIHGHHAVRHMVWKLCHTPCDSSPYQRLLATSNLHSSQIAKGNFPPLLYNIFFQNVKGKEIMMESDPCLPQECHGGPFWERDVDFLPTLHDQSKRFIRFWRCPLCMLLCAFLV